MGWNSKTKVHYSGAAWGSWGASYTVCGCGRWDYDAEIEKNPTCKNCGAHRVAGQKYQQQGGSTRAGALQDKGAKTEDSPLVTMFWKQTAEVQEGLRLEFPAIFGHVGKKEEKSTQRQFRDAAAALNQAVDKKTKYEGQVQKYQKLLDEAKAQLIAAKDEHAKAEIEHDRCTKTYSEAVRAGPQPPAATATEKQKENNPGESILIDNDGGGGDGMELDGQWEPLLATLSVEQKRLYEGARESAAKRRRPGSYSSSERAKQELGATKKLASLMAADSGQRVADGKAGEGQAGGAEGAAAGGQQ